MRKLFALVLLTALTACGGDKGNSSTTSTLGDGNTPNVQIPTDRRVVVSDYACNDIYEYTDETGAPHRDEYPSTGVDHYWKDSGYSLLYSEDSHDDYKTLTKYQKYTLDGGQYRQTSEITIWELLDGKWNKTISQVDRIWKKEGNIRRAQSNKVDGVDQPYYWEIEDTEIDARTSRSVKRHINPGVRDREGRHYTRIELTCTSTDRE